MTSTDPLPDSVIEEAASWLILIEDDPTDAERQGGLRAWLDAAPDHRAAWDRVNRTGAVLRSARFAAPRRPRSVWRPAAAGLAACLALVAMFAIPRVWQTADHSTGTARIEMVSLPDGSSVRLGPETAIRLSYSDQGRQVELLSGEAQFDVVHDPARPFRVIARNATISDIGTRFDVTTLADATSVAVSQGRVEVSSAREPAFELAAGDAARIAAAGPAERESGLPEELTNGPSARIAARNRPVAEVIDRLRPWYGGRIVITDEALARSEVTGVFDATDPVRALETMVGPQGGQVVRITPWLLLVRKG